MRAPDFEVAPLPNGTLAVSFRRGDTVVVLLDPGIMSTDADTTVELINAVLSGLDDPEPNGGRRLRAVA